MREHYKTCSTISNTIWSKKYRLSWPSHHKRTLTMHIHVGLKIYRLLQKINIQKELLYSVHDLHSNSTSFVWSMIVQLQTFAWRQTERLSRRVWQLWLRLHFLLLYLLICPFVLPSCLVLMWLLVQFSLRVHN